MQRGAAKIASFLAISLALLLLIDLPQAAPVSVARSAPGGGPTATYTPQPHFLPYIALGIPPPATATATATAPPQPWLVYLNQFRSVTGVPHLIASTDWSVGGWLHSRYMVKEDIISHSEDPASPWYTAEGDAAGRNGNIAVSSYSGASDESAIDLWMTGPFHAVSILDPRLQQTGFGSYREDVGYWHMGATLDVLRGRGSLPPNTAFPIFYPAPSSELWLASYNGNETPDPLTSCPGYTAPSGSPIIVQLGTGSLTPNVTGHNLLAGGSPVEHCVFDETNYSNPNSTQQATGRLVLGNRDAVVIMPRHPFSTGVSYTASLTVDGQSYAWSFSLSTVVEAPPRPGTWQTGSAGRN